MSRGAIRRFDLDGLYIPRDGMRVYEGGELDMDVFLFLFFSVQFISDCNCNP